MIDVAYLKPSDIVKLRNYSETDFPKAHILASIKEFLTKAKPDEGAGSDHIVGVADALSMANVWDHINPETVAKTLSDAPHSARALFLTGMPRSYAEKVTYSLVTVSDAKESTPVKSAAQFKRLNKNGPYIILTLDDGTQFVAKNGMRSGIWGPRHAKRSGRKFLAALEPVYVIDEVPHQTPKSQKTA